MTHALGRHILCEAYGCDPEVLNSRVAVENIMVQAALEAGAEVREAVFHQFNPQGVSGVVVISESHLAIHTWPEYGYAAVDLFTCGDTVVPEAAYRHLKAGLGSRRASTMEMKRGQLGLSHGRGSTLIERPRRGGAGRALRALRGLAQGGGGERAQRCERGRARDRRCRRPAGRLYRSATRRDRRKGRDARTVF